MSNLDRIITAVESIEALEAHSQFQRHLKSPKNLRHQRSGTSQRISKISSAIDNKLTAVSNLIMNRIDNGAKLENIRGEFEDRVHTIIQTGVWDSKMASLKGIQKFDIDAILRAEDIADINREIIRIEDQFWLGVENKMQEPVEKDTAIIPSSLATDLAFGALAGLTIGAILAHNQKNQAKVELYWLSERDDRVCPICVELDSQAVLPGEPFKSKIISQVTKPPAHPHCRCRVVPKVGNKVFLS